MNYILAANRFKIITNMLPTPAWIWMSTEPPRFIVFQLWLSDCLQCSKYTQPAWGLSGGLSDCPAWPVMSQPTSPQAPQLQACWLYGLSSEKKSNEAVLSWMGDLEAIIGGWGGRSGCITIQPTSLCSLDQCSRRALPAHGLFIGVCEGLALWLEFLGGLGF